MTDKDKVDKFFYELQAKRKAFAENYAYFAAKLAPRFNCFNLIRPDELKLSEILAMLLNPNAEHAQKELFLKLFFATIEIDSPVVTCNIKVDYEVSTHLIENKQRRIDILINFDDKFGLAIENKPWARDQPQQLADYAKQMEKQFGDNWCLVYLSGDDSDLNEDSATKTQIEIWEKDNHYRKINFSHIVDWLQACEAQCQADHVCHFLRDFIGYCKKQFLEESNMIDGNLIKDFSLENVEKLEVALSIGQQHVVIKEELLKKFLSDLKVEFKSAYPEWEFEVDKDFGYWKKWQDIHFRKKEWKNYYFAFEFDRTQCVDFLWGISKVSDKVNDLPEETLDILNTELSKKGFKNTWMPYGSYFPEPYRDWWKNMEPWLDIQSGKIAKVLIEEHLSPLIEAAETILDEAENELQT